MKYTFIAMYVLGFCLYTSFLSFISAVDLPYERYTQYNTQYNFCILSLNDELNTPIMSSFRAT